MAVRALATDLPNNKPLQSIIKKIEVASNVTKNPSIQPLEKALIDSSGGRVIPLGENPVSYSRASRQAGMMGIDSQSTGWFEIMGRWLAQQTWLAGAKLTIIDVLNKWPSWFPKAKDADTRQGTGRASGTNKNGRTAQGFR